MTTYDAVRVWAWQVEKEGRRFKQVNSRRLRSLERGVWGGSVSKFAVSTAAVDLYGVARRAWHEALKREGEKS